MKVWLEEQLKARGWSQRELARRAGLPQSTLSQSLRRLPPDQLRELIDYIDAII